MGQRDKASTTLFHFIKQATRLWTHSVTFAGANVFAVFDRQVILSICLFAIIALFSQDFPIAMKRPSFRKRCRDTFLGLIIRALVFTLPLCPRICLHSLVHLTVFLSHFFHPGLLRLIKANLTIAFPEMSSSERRRLSRQNLRNLLWNGIEIIHLLKRPDRIGQMISSSSGAALSSYRGRPFILCIPHLGNWEILAQAAPHWGHEATAVAAPATNPTVNRLLLQARTANGLQIINHKGAARSMLRALRENKCVGILIDQNISPRDGGEFFNFFGLPVPGSRLPAVLSRRLGIDLFVGACIRGEDGLFHLVLEPLPQAVSSYSDDFSLTQALLDATQALIRKYPEQYTWLYRRWRYIPGNAAASLKASYPYYSVPRPYLCREELLQEVTDFQSSLRPPSSKEISAHHVR